jgi:hypothetical protein
MPDGAPGGQRAALIAAAIAVLVLALVGASLAMRGDRASGRTNVGNGCDPPPSLK